ncbi:PAS domain-containing protein [Skermanella mucosa]|uniref:sensor histidine kinase n=1 Tax=Skermanella mucosa TaxID=1789672 RepID=UPI00192BB5FD|nr:histidine kinase dimerization/phosphoacceptor domain -containing protein [Skermanella mucosa]UEM22221.1 PAS domain-containing protein [Skermanella mucosa]
MGLRNGLWLIAAAAAIPGLLLSAALPALAPAPDPVPASRIILPAPAPGGQVDNAALPGAIVPGTANPAAPLPSVVFAFPPLTVAGLAGALISGLLAAGAARLVLQRGHAGAPLAEKGSRGSGSGSVRGGDEERLRGMAEALPQIVWITGPNGENEYFNRRWFEYSGAAPDDLEAWRDHVHPDDLDGLLESWRAAHASASPWQAEYRLRRADGAHLWHLGRAMPVLDHGGRIVRWFGTATDIDGQKRIQAELARTAAEREQLLRQKDLLLREVHHRVRNNLQLISSLLSLQNRTITDPGTLQQFTEARGRIEAVAQVHEQLYLTDQPDLMDFAAFLQGLCANLSRPGVPVICTRDTPMELPIDEATPLALIANELIANAVEYAYPDEGGVVISGGPVRVILEGRSPGPVELRVEDDGVGLPLDFEQGHGRLGIRLVRQLTRQLRGQLSTGACGEGRSGTSVGIRFDSEPVPPIDLWNDRDVLR